ncbi:hypothetical protein SAMN05421640_2033 [Ekhidna lutea]|uniref:Glycosyl transferases group 1 n=1 Tax=Ekhidna lutea TaxID=447679 RepID=A0A239JBD2_EKHLU|nr:hypothetical protein [Ekhidna lutea]SNT01954.1 hypothetical protein SAMN05421640_2033 [Ekhidna lutea]
MNGKTILLISPESWDDHHVSKHHYAEELAFMGNQVYFLEPKYEIYKEHISSGLTLLRYKKHLSGMRFLPRKLRAKIIVKDFLRIQDNIGRKIDIIWNFDSSRFYELSDIPHQVLKICHLVDLNQNFEWTTLVKTADYCFCVAKPIFKRLCQYNANTHLINHGYRESKVTLDVSLPGDNHIKAVYAGNLDIAYLDHQLIANLIETFTNVDFIFIGGFSENNPLRQIRKKNLFLTGKKPADSLNAYYRKADVLLLAYLADIYQDQVSNSHKIMEYLGSGKTVIASKTTDYLDSPYIEMAFSESEYLKKFDDIINNLELFNAASKQQERIDFARSNSYDKQIARINNILTEKSQ